MSTTLRLLAFATIATVFVSHSFADDLAPPPWERLGLPNFTTAAEWEFLTDTPIPYPADGIEVPLIVGDGIGGMPPEVLPDGDIAWVPFDGDGGYLGGAFGVTSGELNFRVGNWIDEEAFKIVRMQITYDPGPAGLSPFIEEIIPFDPLGIDSVTFLSAIDGPIVGDPLGRWHRLEEWEIRPNPDFESIQVIVPVGVTVDQVVIDTISTSIPEPTTIAMLGLGAVALLGVVRRQR